MKLQKSGRKAKPLARKLHFQLAQRKERRKERLQDFREHKIYTMQTQPKEYGPEDCIDLAFLLKSVFTIVSSIQTFQINQKEALTIHKLINSIIFYDVYF